MVSSVTMNETHPDRPGGGEAIIAGHRRRGRRDRWNVQLPAAWKYVRDRRRESCLKIDLARVCESSSWAATETEM
jgi:hypothetical protein